MKAVIASPVTGGPVNKEASAGLQYLRRVKKFNGVHKKLSMLYTGVAISRLLCEGEGAHD